MRLLITPYHDMPPPAEQEILICLGALEVSRINSYQGRARMQRLLGLDLLGRQLRHFNLPWPLSGLCRTAYNKPYFKDTAFNFSISHAGNYVLCLASCSARVGADIEFEDRALVNVDSDFLSEAEKRMLEQPACTREFYRLHTRKEALAKAMGQGVFLSHRDFNVGHDSLQAAGSTWYFNTFRLEDQYTVSCVSEGMEPLETVIINA